MRKSIVFLITANFLLILGCKETAPVAVQTFDQPYVNQVNTQFSNIEMQCLLDQYHSRTYDTNGPVVFRVINDLETFNSFFACQSETKPAQIDFSKYTLLIGMNTGLEHPSPINISKMNQSLINKDNEDYTLRVTVTGKNSPEGKTGNEWFAFSFLTLKIAKENNVTLEMRYEYLD
jgi:hypothetical protein